MDPSTSYVLSDKTYDRMIDALDRVDALPPRRQSGQAQLVQAQSAPVNWIKITSITTSTVTLTGAGTIQCYPALWSYYDAGAGAWVDSSDTVWFLPANGETPVVNTRYQARLAGVDSSGKAIYLADMQGAGAFSGAYYSGSATTSVPTGTTFATQLGTGALASIYDTSSYGTSLTAPSAGYYAGMVNVQFAATAVVGICGVEVLTSASQLLAVVGGFPLNNIIGGANVQVYYEAHLASGESLGWYAYQNSGGNLNAVVKQQTIHKLG